VTVCPQKRIDEKLKAYIDEHPEKFLDESEHAEFREFIIQLATISYDKMDTFPTGNDFGIKPDEYLELMNDLKWDFTPEISSGTSNKLIMMRSITGESQSLQVHCTSYANLFPKSMESAIA